MREKLARFRQGIQGLWVKYGEQSRLLRSARRKLTHAFGYLNDHPRVKYATMGIGALSVLLLAFIMFILTQTPSKAELTTIKNAVASEVYSADSVLLGRYFIQEKTNVPLHRLTVQRHAEKKITLSFYYFFFKTISSSRTNWPVVDCLVIVPLKVISVSVEDPVSAITFWFVLTPTCWSMAMMLMSPCSLE